jgi:hypothetical protein
MLQSYMLQPYMLHVTCDSIALGLRVWVECWVERRLFEIQEDAEPSFLNRDRITGAIRTQARQTDTYQPRLLRQVSSKKYDGDLCKKEYDEKYRKCRYAFRWTDGICCDGRAVSHINQVSITWRLVRTLRSVRQSGRCKRYVRAGLTGTTTAFNCEEPLPREQAPGPDIDRSDPRYRSQPDKISLSQISRS